MLSTFKFWAVIWERIIQTFSAPWMRVLINIQLLKLLSGFTLCLFLLKKKSKKKKIEDPNAQKRLLSVLFSSIISSSDSRTRLSFMALKFVPLIMDLLNISVLSIFLHWMKSRLPTIQLHISPSDGGRGVALSLFLYSGWQICLILHCCATG